MYLKAKIMDSAAMKRALIRVCHEIVERNKGTDDLVFVGICTRGVPLAKQLSEYIRLAYNISVPVGILDIGLYRDDLDQTRKEPVVNVDKTEFSFDVADKKVILVDDVLFTGRTVRAAIEEIMRHGRPRCIQLAVLVDRGHRELPIRADYVGKHLPTSINEVVSVSVAELDGENSVCLYENS